MITTRSRIEVEATLKCTGPRELNEWFALYWPTSNPETTTEGILKNFCLDCTPEYQKAMLAEGRCINTCES